MDIKIGFIGGGNMATSLIGGLIEGGHAASDIIVYDPSSERSKQLAQQFQINTAADNSSLIKQSDVVVIAVKPQVLEKVLKPLVHDFNAQRPLIVSVVAGIRASSIEKWLEAEHALVRVMPNTPALIGAGASGLYANKKVSDGQRSIASNLLNCVGNSVWLETEADIDSVTALSGSGPAYFMLFIKELIDSAVKAGIDQDSAKRLAVQTAIGAAQLVEQSEDSLQTLIDNVTSPNGTTEAALKSFEQSNLQKVVADAFSAAKLRSEELANELG